MRRSHAIKDQPARLANIGYIAELVKFRLISAASIFQCLKAMVDDFNPANVQAGAPHYRPPASEPSLSPLALNPHPSP